ncbi:MULTISPECIES: hypothetical protein [Caldilinea]|uniref:hypothetical protein n=1 Tax=Caldilinea TaxID=233191 RepID=UPI001396737D|nr:MULTISPECIES: hypothetical protein [Caldilinea]
MEDDKNLRLCKEIGIKTTAKLHKRRAAETFVHSGCFGQRKLYAGKSPEVRFFDEGLARLQGGVARVELDPVFLETIEGDYLVHVTPYGDASLYVAEVGKDYFVVKARDGDLNVAFAWRLSAHRKGYAGVRLEAVGEPGNEGAEMQKQSGYLRLRYLPANQHDQRADDVQLEFENVLLKRGVDTDRIPGFDVVLCDALTQCQERSEIGIANDSLLDQDFQVVDAA